MNQNTLYVGLDVDDTQYHGTAFNKDTGVVICANADAAVDLRKGPVSGF